MSDFFKKRKYKRVFIFLLINFILLIIVFILNMKESLYSEDILKIKNQILEANLLSKNLKKLLKAKQKYYFEIKKTNEKLIEEIERKNRELKFYREVLNKLCQKMNFKRAGLNINYFIANLSKNSGVFTVIIKTTDNNNFLKNCDRECFHLSYSYDFLKKIITILNEFDYVKNSLTYKNGSFKFKFKNNTSKG